LGYLSEEDGITFVSNRTDSECAGEEDSTEQWENLPELEGDELTEELSEDQEALSGELQCIEEAKKEEYDQMHMHPNLEQVFRRVWANVEQDTDNDVTLVTCRVTIEDIEVWRRLLV
jgi:hypothetical protein